ncbi:MAG: thiosulfate oxidation carrier protein SoxY [Thioalkalivibrio sp.]|nr:thiosulfate oxidation carrier protein SoxY [Thioalkalivibrio sp.]
MKRRWFLKGTLATTVALAAPWLLIPMRVLGAWPQQAFLAEDVDVALVALIGNVEILPDERTVLSTPDFAENGAMVPVGVATDVPGADSVILVSEPNPFPLIANFHLKPRLRGTITTRIRMGGSGDLVAIIRAGGRYYGTRQHVRVATGGC